MAQQIICGIDIGTSKIATVVAVDGGDTDEVRVIGFNSTPSKGVKKGVIVDIDQVTNAVEQSVEKAERMAGQKITKAYVSVGGPHIASFNSHGVVAVTNPQGEIADTDLQRVTEAARAVSLQGQRQIIDVTPREYSVDGQSGIKNPIGMSGIRLEVETHIITASNINLKNIDRVVADVGIANEGFVFSGLAAADSILTETERDLGVAIADIGAGKMDMCIYVEGALSHSVSIPIGARHITNDIAVGLRVSLDSAGKIKLHMGKYVRNYTEFSRAKKSEPFKAEEVGIPETVEDITEKMLVDGIIIPRVEEIYEYIGAEIEKSGYAKLIPAGLVITGGGALTLGMVEVGKKMLGLPIRVGVPTKATGLVDEIMNPQFATTIGLIFVGEKHIMNDKESIGTNFRSVFSTMSMDGMMKKVKELFRNFIP